MPTRRVLLGGTVKSTGRYRLLLRILPGVVRELSAAVFRFSREVYFECPCCCALCDSVPPVVYIYKWKPFTTNAVVVFLAVTGGSSL